MHKFKKWVFHAGTNNKVVNLTSLNPFSYNLTTEVGTYEINWRVSLSPASAGVNFNNRNAVQQLSYSPSFHAWQ